MAPIVHGLEADYAGKVNFVYLDIDDSQNDEFKRSLGYRVQPHFFLLDSEGNVLQQWVGVVQQDELVAALNQAIDSSLP
jgi:thioredoxin-like negative regulator of GroEL